MTIQLSLWVSSGLMRNPGSKKKGVGGVGWCPRNHTSGPNLSTHTHIHTRTLTYTHTHIYIHTHTYYNPKRKSMGMGCPGPTRGWSSDCGWPLRTVGCRATQQATGYAMQWRGPGFSRGSKSWPAMFLSRVIRSPRLGKHW